MEDKQLNTVEYFGKKLDNLREELKKEISNSVNEELFFDDDSFTIEVEDIETALLKQALVSSIFKGRNDTIYIELDDEVRDSISFDYIMDVHDLFAIHRMIKEYV